VGMSLMTIALALAFQDPAPPPSFRAAVTVERYLRREDRVAVETGTLSVRPGAALLFESRTQRLLLRDGKSFERRAGERFTRVRDLSRPEFFQPLDLWRIDARSLRERFVEIDDRDAVARPLPAAVVTLEGKAIPPVKALLSESSLARVEGEDRAEGCRRVVLVPRDPALRSRIASMRLSVDRASGRILSAVVDGPSQVLTLTLGDYQEVASMEDAVFEMDLSNLKVEDR
jgi:hypothetical protein